MPRSVPAMLNRPPRELDVRHRRFQHMGGDLAAALDHRPPASTIAAPLFIMRARAAGAAAGQQLVGIALQQADALERHAEPVHASTWANGVAWPWP